MSRTNKDAASGFGIGRVEVEEILRDVTFPHYRWEVGGSDRTWLRANFYASVTTRAPRDLTDYKKQFTRRWYVSRHATRSEVVQTALKCVLTSIEHEAREKFLYRGRAIFGPHFDVDALVNLFDAGAISERKEVA